MRTRHDVVRFTRERWDKDAADNWNEMTKRYPLLLLQLRPYHSIKIWRWGTRRLRQTSGQRRARASAGVAYSRLRPTQEKIAPSA
jgi:hypothetical protein